LGDQGSLARALEDQETATLSIRSAISAAAHFNSESLRLLPAVAASLTTHARNLAALKSQLSHLEHRAARCRERAITLAERQGVDTASLHLHDPDAEILDGH
jgi:hypothetical protein